jgi:glucokinase
MAASELLVGVDLGGTKIAAGLFSTDRKLLSEIATAPTAADQPAEVTLGNLERVIREVLPEGTRPLAVGVGSTGPVDAASGRFLEATSLPNLYFFDLASWVRDRFGAPLFLENDANCLALGEALQGAGAGHASVVAVTLGTGFGCGIVLGGVMYSGVTGNAGEVAFCPVAGGTYDEMLSGAGVRRFYERVRNAPTGLSAREIGELGEAGDPAALEAWKYFGQAVGSALGTIAAVLDPSICVVGGSVAARLGLFRGALEQRLRAILAPDAARSIRVVEAQLGSAAGVIGAAEYAWYRVKKQ